MGEREIYYEHSRLAIDAPSRYMSVISDGMAQNHCELPYFSNLHQYANRIGQHLQGILSHGQSMTIYRTFGNFKGGWRDIETVLYIYCKRITTKSFIFRLIT
jgi:hypothetical protein